MFSCLENYKSEILDLSDNNDQKKFISDSFPRWYIRVSHKDNLFPARNIILENIDDFKYANKNKRLQFNIYNLINKSKEIHSKYDNLCNKLDDIINNTELDILITPQQLARLKKLYKGNKKQFDIEKYKLISLYKFLGMTTMHLSMPPIYKGIELFGSPLNTKNQYCSPFEIEKQFGSLGSFWYYKFHKNGLYLCNPPFDEIVIKNMANRLNNMLGETKYKVIVVVTIPVWDSKSQRELNIKDYGLPFEGYDILSQSKYCKETKMLDKFIYKYFDYYSGKLIPASYTHLLILSNYDDYTKKFSLSDFLDNWKNFLPKTHIN